MSSGGKRPGAGRKHAPVKKKYYSFYLTEVEAEKVKEIIKKIKK